MLCVSTGAVTPRTDVGRTIDDRQSLAEGMGRPIRRRDRPTALVVSAVPEGCGSSVHALKSSFSNARCVRWGSMLGCDVIVRCLAAGIFGDAPYVTFHTDTLAGG